MRKGNSPPTILHFKQLEEYENEYYPDNLNLSFSSHTSLQLLMFPFLFQKVDCDHIENENRLKEKFGNFSRSQKNRDLFFL